MSQNTVCLVIASYASVDPFNYFECAWFFDPADNSDIHVIYEERQQVLKNASAILPKRTAPCCSAENTSPTNIIWIFFLIWKIYPPLI